MLDSDKMYVGRGGTVSFPLRGARTPALVHIDDSQDAAAEASPGLHASAQ